MNSRLQQFMIAENLSQSQFADKIGVARASISHIMSGRNKPGFDFILGMARSFPALNLDWLITGKGKMYKQSEVSLKVEPVDNDLFSNNDFIEDEPVTPDVKKVVQPIQKISNVADIAPKKPLERGISRIVVFYDDNTFQEFQ